MAQFGNQMQTGLFDHLQGIMVAKCPIIDKIDDLDVITNQLQEARDGLLDETESGGQLDSSSTPIFAALRSSPFPRGLFL